MMKYLGAFSRKLTPQSQPIPGEQQVQNNAGGFVYALGDWGQLDRFLILGAESSTYYASLPTLQRDNAQATLRCISENGQRTVARIVEISLAGRAPKNGPAIFALALAAANGDEATRHAAREALPAVCRTASHLFEFAAYANGMRGWGRGLRSAIANWYESRDERDLAYQLVKYQSREGWSNRDLLRLTHPKAEGVRNDLYHWAVKGWPTVGNDPHPDRALSFIWAFEKAKTTTDERELAALIREYRLPREAVPTTALTSPDVWEALLEDMPAIALIRNLATMTRVSLLTARSEATQYVLRRLGDADALARARVHPIQLLSALTIYERGCGARSETTWTPVKPIVEALDAAFYSAFKSVEPTGKRIVLALDVSGSMTFAEIAGVPGLTPRVGSAAMALVTKAVEKNVRTVAFTAAQGKSANTAISELRLPSDRLASVLEKVGNLPAAGTDCALPMLWALEQHVEADAFVIYTDNETWAGNIHPSQALRKYREATGIPARLIVVGMTSTGFTIADPNDPGMLDVVGFDSAAPQIMADFIANR